ncbi:MAG: methyltransferase domain-containing protein [Myxococcota bacterium]
MTNPTIRRLRVRLRFAVAATFLLASSAAAESEFERTASLLGLAPGMTVAEIGAGDGDFTVELARRVGPEGRVYATEIESEKRDQSAAEAREAGLANVQVLEAKLASTGLPEGCCRAVFMRHVYHHLTDPAALDRDLLRALEPGGLLVIVDFPPTWYLVPFAPEGVGEERTEHGIEIDAALRELVAAGFETVRVIEDWDTGWLGPDSYALVLRKPSADRAP